MKAEMNKEIQMEAHDEGNSPVYAQMVNDVRSSAVTVAELANLTGVSERQVTNWANGSSRPSSASRDRLLEVHYIVELLGDVYDDEGVEIWLRGRKKSLGGQRPMDLLLAGEFEEVRMAVERLRTGAM